MNTQESPTKAPVKLDNETDVFWVKKIIEDELGIVDFESYDKYKKSLKGKISLKDLWQLHPDRISGKAFWEYTSKSVFAIDAVCNLERRKEKDVSRSQANTFACQLACASSVLSYLFMHAYSSPLTSRDKFKVLEIGAGFGMLKELCEHFKMDYTGLDVYPLVDGVLEVDRDGNFPKEVLNSEYDLIISSNVFQHFSLKQRKNYYAQIADVLSPFGVFSLNLLVSDHLMGGGTGWHCEETGKNYLCHYGQFTPVQNISEVNHNLAEHFKMLSIMNQSNISTWHLNKK